MLQQKTGAQAIYNILNTIINNDSPTGMLSWNKKYAINTEGWKKIFEYPFKVTRYPAMQWFQTCINHNILVTNSFLYKAKLRNDQACYY